MNTRFYNAKILNEDFTVTEGELLTEGNRIKGIGSCGDGSYKPDKEIVARGNLLIPGFVNAHTHSAMTLMRSYADDMPLDKWLFDKIFPVEGKMSAEDVYWLVRLAILEYVKGGITSAFDMYFHMDSAVKAAADSGFRVTLCGAVNDFGGSADSLREQYKKYNGVNDLTAFKLGIHAEYTTKLDLIRECGALAGEFKQPMFAHCSETKKEVDECYGRYGKSPVEIFAESGFFNYGGGIFHGVWLSDKDIQILREYNVTVVTNPCSNLKLASGIAETAKLDKAGVKLAIGTDGASSNNALSMFREMYLVTALQKYTANDSAAMPPERVMTFASKNGGELLGIKTGILKEGYLADIVMIDLNQPNMRPVNNILKNIVYSADTGNVKMTMVNGKILYNNGEYFVNEDVCKIYEECEKISKRLCV